MKRFRISDGTGADVIEANDMQDAMDTASSNWKMGDWDTKSIVEVRVVEIDADGKEIGDADWVDVEVGEDPTPPECTEDDHDFVADHSVVGGLKENPGVWSAGGTRLKILTCCKHCGSYKREVIVGAQHNPGECDTVEYLPADEASIAWIEATA
jgi:hypothetical protein